jgi:hypothetical protein
MRIWRRIRAPWMRAVMASFCVVCFGTSQQLPDPLTGPGVDGADYAYLSMVTARKGQNGPIYDLRYDLCNRRTRKMAFVWEDVGFGMDDTAPLPAGLCASYELVGLGYKLKTVAPIRFSSGSRPATAYLPCAEKTGCDAESSSGLATLTATLTTVVSKILPAEKPGETNRPVSVLSPLHVIVRATRGQDGRVHAFRIDWTGTGITFLAYFPNGKLSVDDLKQMIGKTTGGKFEFVTFPSLKNAEFIMGSTPSDGAIRMEPGESAQFGTYTVELSPKAPSARTIRLIVLAEQNRATARLDLPAANPPR